MTDISIDKGMKIVFANKAALKILQYKIEEVTNLPIVHIMPAFIAESH